MPLKSLRPCSHPGCAALIRYGRYCDQHQPRLGRPVVAGQPERLTAAQRGYGAPWRKLRAQFLARHPVCVDPDHRHPGQVRAATDVDHITPRSQGGSDDPTNLQPLCHACHSAKTLREQGRIHPAAASRPGRGA